MSGMEIITTDVPCRGCGDMLCNLCGLNGICQDCGTSITPEQHSAIRTYLESRSS